MMLAALLACAVPLAAEPAATAVAESKLEHSSASVMVEPKLDDGRLVVKIAVLNRTSAGVAFGPASISLAKPSGEAIALVPLSRLVDDVRLAAGMRPEGAPQASNNGAYAAPQTITDSSGRPDVSGYTGTAGISRDEIIRRSAQHGRSKPTISKADAAAQIAALNQAIIHDVTVAPGQVAAGQVVSEKLKFAKGEDRTIHLRIRIAGDEHGFTIAAPTG